jgi:hypothetical protein
MKEKLRDRNTGKQASEATREKMREAHIGLFAGEKHPLFGTKSTEEANERRREKLAGRPKSEQMKAKLRATIAERPCGFSGRKHSPETRARIAESLRKRNESNASLRTSDA